MSDTTPVSHRTVEAVWRIESAPVIASLARLVRDVGLAEELAQDALLAALEHWPRTGVPERPGAWLLAVGRRRGLDLLRRQKRMREREDAVGAEIEARHAAVPAPGEALDEPIRDDLLRLMFVSCHPLLAPEARAALTLRLLGGLSTAEIARAFLTTEPAVAQRIVRAKRTLAEARVPFEVPRGEELRARLGSVLEVLYLVFNEGYSASAGDDLLRPALCEDAMRLGRVLSGLMPDEPEVHGLVALMELQASRFRARVSATGEPVLLLEQDRSRWDRLLIQRGLAALARAESLGVPLGPYALQAAIAACHARALQAADTDWARIAALYDALAEAVPTPVVCLNRAVAVGMAFGPADGLRLVDELCDEPALARYHLLPAARADLLEKLRRFPEAASEFERAAGMAGNERERALLRTRASRCRNAGSPA